MNFCNTDEYSCPKCRDNARSNPNIKFLVNECGHGICQNCVNIMFSRETANCPACNRQLKRSEFRQQIFDDPIVERDLSIRKSIMKDFNRIRSDFATLHEYNDYLEMRETIIMNLVEEVDVENTRQRIKQYQEENAEEIRLNREREHPELREHRMREEKARALKQKCLAEDQKRALEEKRAREKRRQKMEQLVQQTEDPHPLGGDEDDDDNDDDDDEGGDNEMSVSERDKTARNCVMDAQQLEEPSREKRARLHHQNQQQQQQQQQEESAMMDVSANGNEDDATSGVAQPYHHTSYRPDLIGPSLPSMMAALMSSEETEEEEQQQKMEKEQLEMKKEEKKSSHDEAKAAARRMASSLDRQEALRRDTIPLDGAFVTDERAMLDESFELEKQRAAAGGAAGEAGGAAGGAAESKERARIQRLRVGGYRVDVLAQKLRKAARVQLFVFEPGTAHANNTDNNNINTTDNNNDDSKPIDHRQI